MSERIAMAASLARFAVDRRAGHVPPSIVRESKRALVNAVGAALGGCRDSAIEAMATTLAPLAGPPQAALFGRGSRADIATAAELNAASANVLDFDDAHLSTVIHPAAPVLGPCFALAEHRHASGQAFLEAFAIGMEIACRLGEALTQRHYLRGFHITATCGAVGAAFACSRLLDLSADRTAHAGGIAATQAAGLVENLGFVAKSVGVGAAARTGLLAALYAANGADAAPHWLEGKRGFLAVLSDAPDPAKLLDGLGERWELARNTYKPYPTGVVLNPVLDAALEIAGAPDFDVAQVGRVSVRGAPLLLERADRPHVETGREAKISLQHAVARALLRRRIGVEDFLDPAVADGATCALRARIFATSDIVFGPESAAVEASMADGSIRRARVAQARGSVARPLSDADIDAKFDSLVAYGAPAIDARAARLALRSIDESPDCGIAAAALLGLPAAQ